MLSLVLLLVSFASISLCSKKDFDCPMRLQALNFAAYIQPELSMDQLQEIADGLNGAQEAENCSLSPSDINKSYLTNRKQHRQPKDWSNERTHLFTPNSENFKVVYIYVDTIKGSDYENDGSEVKPYKTIEYALLKSRNYGISTLKYIILRKGRYYLKNTINFSYFDANLIIRNYNNERVEISGAKVLNCDWKLYQNMSDGYGIYTCVDSTVKTPIEGLRVNGDRGIRARYPNANPETDGFDSKLRALEWSAEPPPYEPEFEYNPLDYPVRNDSVPYWFWYYGLGTKFEFILTHIDDPLLIGMGGVCDNFVPNAGYWCSSQNMGGGSFTYRTLTGMKFNQDILPHSPYSNPINGVIQVWRPAKWASWMFEIGAFTDTSFNFSKGGFQGARGDNRGEEFYIENVIEELDAPGEWFWNDTTNTLYYYNNETGVPNQVFERTDLKVLFNFTGTMSKPAMNISIQGVTLRDTAITYLDPHGMPSGGDWGLQRQGAVFMDGVENVIISHNLLTRLDGVGISINRYARNVTIEYNEIAWTGDTAITSWGDTEGITFEDSKTQMGYDGTTGNQPRGLKVYKNYVHELGIWQKQSSFYFQSKSCLNDISHNVFFNGPRAAINVNDGFGGGTTIYRNLIFNSVRESSDHGPFNSWDRQPYVTKVKTGVPSVEKSFDEISKNFIICNYNGYEAIDNDDGSCYYNVHNNYFVYGENGLKSDFGGHDIQHTQNIYAYVNRAFESDIEAGQLAGHNDMFMFNTVVLNVPRLNYGTFGCIEQSQDTWPYLSNNVLYTPDGNPNATGLCDRPEKEFQEKFNTDLGTVILPYNDNAVLLQAEEMLFS